MKKRNNILKCDLSSCNSLFPIVRLLLLLLLLLVVFNQSFTLLNQSICLTLIIALTLAQVTRKDYQPFFKGEMKQNNNKENCI